MPIFKLTFTVNYGLGQAGGTSLIPQLLARNPFGTCTALYDDSASVKRGDQALEPAALQDLLRKKLRNPRALERY